MESMETWMETVGLFDEAVLMDKRNQRGMHRGGLAAILPPGADAKAKEWRTFEVGDQRRQRAIHGQMEVREVTSGGRAVAMATHNQ